MKLYVIVQEYDCEGYNILGLGTDKKVMVEKAKYFIRKHKTSVKVREYESDTFSDDGIEIYNAYWCYYKYLDMPSFWRFYEKEEGCEYVRIKEIVENGP